ncbi:hypothetical protein LZD49_09105 [Dyadobacter sp. CY261]|uniref:hypothetical protein n=1 Tax=Dyadobacter sp. CY261 TaxID=2907203 RepID=UPI001F40E1B0|nr:hypothetical protein [Dyadobacter sp. CY261]MCF0070628.1 hypothetical protein [Dyadobacter sp. CY261]
MEKHKDMEYEARIAELLKDKEKIIAAIKNSPGLQRRNREAAEMLSKLKPPFPWDDDYAQKRN